MRFLGYRLERIGGRAALAMLALTLVFTLALTPGCSPVPLARYEFQRVQMGVQSRVTVYSKSEQIARDAAAAAFDRIAQLEDHFSDYRPRSELSKLSDRAGGAQKAMPVEVSPELFDILRTSLTISRASGFAFDVAIGRSVRLWRDSRKSAVLPSQAQIEAAKATGGEGAIELVAATRSVRLPKAGTRIDLGGIAKGYAAQAGVERLRELGHPICLVSLAGDIAAGEAPPGARGWTILADSEQNGGTPRRLTISNAAASTSGDTFQFVEIAGVRYSHIIDPRTGLGMTTHRSVTTVALEGAIADGVATAMTVFGRDAAADLCARFHVAAIISEPGGNAETIDPFGLLAPLPE